MSRRWFPLVTASLVALPVGASAQSEGAMAEVTGARIMACEADRNREGCATLLSQIFVCDAAPEMDGCADLMALREAAVNMDAREAELRDAEPDEDIGIVDEPDDHENEVEVRAEGELAEELADEALTEGEERLREEADDGDTEGTTGRPEGDAEEENGANDDGAAVPDSDASSMTCPVLDSADWAAWVNAMPGPDGPSLIVTGRVTLPTPGYSVTLEAGASDRSTRPVQVVQLRAQPPAVDAAQVVSDYDVRFEMPSAAPVDGTTAPFTAIRVVCGDEEIARIEPVEVAQ